MTATSLAELAVGEVPTYTAAEAGRYARSSAQSVARWRAGYTYPTQRGQKASGPVTGGAAHGLLSFNDLVEVAVVSAARKHVSMKVVRGAVDAARKLYGVERPLMLLKFMHDGRELFVHELAQASGDNSRFVNLSRSGQVAWDDIKVVLNELEYDNDLAVRWYPAGRDTPIAIDPNVSFGRPYIIHKGISTDAVRTRILAREPLASIAEDLDLTDAEIEAAIRFELPSAA